jgi:hypothetical protein
MPELQKKPAVNKKPAKKTMFADKDNDFDIGKFMPSANGEDTALTSGKPIGKGLPSAKINAGPVAIHNPKPERNLSMSNQMGNFLQGMGDEEEETGYDNEEERPEDPVVETMPAIIQTALSTEKGEIPSYQMSNIIQSAPPQMQKQLQKIGRDIFSQHSETPKSLKDVYAVTSLTNSETEVKLMVAWIIMHGRKISDAEYNFPSMPGYKPKAELWEDNGARFLIVRETPKDFAGEEIEQSFDDDDFEDKVDNKQCLFYIYGWDEPRERLEGDGGLRAGLLEAATQLVRRFPGQTIREAYEELLLDYLSENIK